MALLPEVVADVAERACFAWVEPCEGARFAALVLAASGAPPSADERRWLRATVRFSGLVAGSLEIVLTDELARELGVAMLGTPAAPLTQEQLCDIAGELANMVCGALLTRVDRDQPFQLRPPQIERLAEWPGDGRSEHALLFCMNDRPVSVGFNAGGM